MVPLSSLLSSSSSGADELPPGTLVVMNPIGADSAPSIIRSKSGSVFFRTGAQVPMSEFHPDSKPQLGTVNPVPIINGCCAAEYNADDKVLIAAGQFVAAANGLPAHRIMHASHDYGNTWVQTMLHAHEFEASTYPTGVLQYSRGVWVFVPCVSSPQRFVYYYSVDNGLSWRVVAFDELAFSAGIAYINESYGCAHGVFLYSSNSYSCNIKITFDENKVPSVVFKDAANTFEGVKYLHLYEIGEYRYYFNLDHTRGYREHHQTGVVEHLNINIVNGAHPYVGVKAKGVVIYKDGIGFELVFIVGTGSTIYTYLSTLYSLDGVNLNTKYYAANLVLGNPVISLIDIDSDGYGSITYCVGGTLWVSEYFSKDKKFTEVTSSAGITAARRIHRTASVANTYFPGTTYKSFDAPVDGNGAIRRIAYSRGILSTGYSSVGAPNNVLVNMGDVNKNTEYRYCSQIASLAYIAPPSGMAGYVYCKA